MFTIVFSYFVILVIFVLKAKDADVMIAIETQRLGILFRILQLRMVGAFVRNVLTNMAPLMEVSQPRGFQSYWADTGARYLKDRGT